MDDLQAIYSFYEDHSPKLADRIVGRIIDRVDLLKRGYLEIGQIEPLLAGHPGKPRYLLEGITKLFTEFWIRTMF